jgi:hypothetical protein
MTASSAATFLPQKFSHEQLRLIVDLYDEDTAFVLILSFERNESIPHRSFSLVLQY